ncbi:MAG: hypothetical protein GYA02_11105, partial [Clostridiaceae bacterium]|nr:hypothetical protein [Clostridiaceae bacterium]
MKLVHLLGHNPNWNTEIYFEQNVGDEFLITAFTFGNNYYKHKRVSQVLEKSMIDLQFYGHKESAKLSKGKLSEFDFHPAKIFTDIELSKQELHNSVVKAIIYQSESRFNKIIIPAFYEDENIESFISIVKSINRFLRENKVNRKEYYMTVPLAYDIIRNKENVERLLFELTDFNICFDGYFIVCENKPEQGQKISNDIKIIRNLSRFFCVLKNQRFKTIYAYANWDALFYLAQTDIDYITIGTYENLRNFFIRRFTDDISGGASDGYYFSEQLLNMIRAKDLISLRSNNIIGMVENRKNIFSDIILGENYVWNIHKPEVNKNYLLSISHLLKQVSKIYPIRNRKIHVLFLIESAIQKYNKIREKYVHLQNESRNYHLDVWKMHLLKKVDMKPDDFET